jgi:hypothetical protein
VKVLLLTTSIASAVLALTIMLGLRAAIVFRRSGNKRKNLIHKRDSLRRQIELLKTRHGWMTVQEYEAINRRKVMLEANLQAVEASLYPDRSWEQSGPR